MYLFLKDPENWAKVKTPKIYLNLTVWCSSMHYQVTSAPLKPRFYQRL